MREDAALYIPPSTCAMTSSDVICLHVSDAARPRSTPYDALRDAAIPRHNSDHSVKRRTLPIESTWLSTWLSQLNGCEPPSAQQHHVWAPSAHASLDLPGTPAPLHILAICSSLTVVSGFPSDDDPPKPGAAPITCEVGAAVIVPL